MAPNDPSKIDLDRIVTEDREIKREKQAHKERQLTVRDYIGLVEQDPLIAQNAYARGCEVVLGEKGGNVVEIPDEERWFNADRRYPFFATELFGIDHAIAKVVEYLQAGAHRASSARQVLLLVGPPGSGKSTLVDMLQKGFERYNLRGVYMLKDCPMFEDPLHVLPRYLREEFDKKLGIRIEGDLCPVCRDRMEKEFTSKNGEVLWENMPVEPLTFSLQAVRGLTSFEPSDEKSSNLANLTGKENVGITTNPKFGHMHPRAFDLVGALPRGNRGVCQAVELTKNDDETLGIFFSVAQERRFKIPDSSFPHIYVDIVIIGHTNLTPLKKFAGNKDNEGLHDRFIVVPFPYPLRVKDELAVYKKLIERDSDFVLLKKCHIAPGALELAALFAILTRLVPSQKNVNLLTKAKIYNGETLLTDLEDATTRPRDTDELLKEGQGEPGTDMVRKEGMFGVSSRATLAALNAEIVRQMSRKKCLTPLLVIKALREMFNEGHRMGPSPEDIARFEGFLTGEKDSVMAEYKEFIVNIVNEAYLKTYPDFARKLFDRYIEEAELFCGANLKFLRGTVPQATRDPVTGKPRGPDIKFLESVEAHMGYDKEQAKGVRGELLMTRGKDFSPEKAPVLFRAVKKKLLQENKTNLRLVLATDKARGTEDAKRAEDLFSVMKRDYNFCGVCAQEAVERANEYIQE